MIGEYSKVDYLPRGNASDMLTEGCLCLEGGAFRGIYTEGVLDYLMQQDINLQTVIGVSAGALAGVNYVSGQIGRSARISLRYRHDPRLVGIGALKRSHSILNISFLFDEIREDDPMDEERFNRPEQRFLCVATNYDTGEPEYFEKGICKDIFSAVQASATMPFIAPAVDVDGIRCMDGGCSCKIPYEWALREEFAKIVVVKTRDRSFRKDNEEKHTARRVYRKHPEFALAQDMSHIHYNEQCDEIDRLEAEGRIFVIAPSQPVEVDRLEPHTEKLADLYYLGYEDAGRILPDLKKYLGIDE